MKTITQFAKIEYQNQNGKFKTHVPVTVVEILQSRGADITVIDNINVPDFWDAEYIEDKEFNAKHIKIRKGVIMGDQHFSYASNMLLSKGQMNNRRRDMNAWAKQEYNRLKCYDMPRASGLITMLSNKGIR